MAAKKCDCSKCIHCKIIIGPGKYRTYCSVYDELYTPNYCDKFMTEKEYNLYKELAGKVEDK